MTVRELLARMDSQELAEWMAFYELEPWGEVRADWRVGNVAALLRNIHRSEDERTFSPQDFMWKDPEPEDPRPGWQRLLDKVRGINAMLGGK